MIRTSIDPTVEAIKDELYNHYVVLAKEPTEDNLLDIEGRFGIDIIEVKKIYNALLLEK